MILILILLILIGLTTYCMFKAYYNDNTTDFIIFLIGTGFFLFLLLRAIAIELNLLT